MRRELAATCVALLCLTGCASAGDIASLGRDTLGTPTMQRQSPGSAPRTRPPTKSGSTTAHPTPRHRAQPPPRRRVLPHPVGAVSTFLTPSRNIGCLISANAVRCDIRRHEYADPVKPPSCRGDYGQSVELSRHGRASFVCVTDTVVDTRATVLAYGTSTVAGDFGCTSSVSGIHCYYLQSDHGFELSRESPALF